MTDLGDRRIWPALAREVDSTFALLTTSDRMLAEMRHLSLDLDPFFACFSAGAERFLKLVHGLATYDKTGAWPSRMRCPRILAMPSPSSTRCVSSTSRTASTSPRAAYTSSSSLRSRRPTRRPSASSGGHH